MAIFIKTLFASIVILFSLTSVAHTIYAPNDIPLLDNRFRIDPKTEQATFIFHHKKGYQQVVLVKPDGSKLYQQRHPESVAWVSNKKQDIVTIQNPMAGPWQAIAELDDNNRIKIISEVQLSVNRLPLKLYAQEYITTHAALYSDKKLMINPNYIKGAKLSISLLGGASNKMALYQDDGKHYDELPFDGKLTARLYVDLQPGRYLLHIRTKNDIFIRNVNKDAVVFLSPLKYKIKALETGSDQANITFTVDGSEIDPSSVSINGVLKDTNNKVVQQVLMHSLDTVSESGEFNAPFKLGYDIYTFSGKAYATTRTGREVELQLRESVFELTPKFEMPEQTASEALATQTEQTLIEETTLESLDSPSLFDNLWIIIAISISLLLFIAGIAFFLFKRKQKQINSDDGDSGELSLDELQPMPIDLTDSK
ncbi:hypothetical protein [Psychromonas sp. Urea-02u-13]|uniref:hypothetical protein n=1 Tax=Psychromonas sp. Urea-02u-13 TaxID=2058326 RepID=UPI000C3353C9|nr:hypothetical protein [Psychromonas sp. Urea-02u-13]PKG40619.1 hypothetical protein CXF74_02005 [Psychromonas sp. Urea-02u-13]